MIKTLGRTSWEKIKVGEVFVCKAVLVGWVIMFKVDTENFMELAYEINCFLYFLDETGGVSKWRDYGDLLYKLPKSAQRLWKEE